MSSKSRPRSSPGSVPSTSTKPNAWSRPLQPKKTAPGPPPPPGLGALPTAKTSTAAISTANGHDSNNISNNNSSLNSNVQNVMRERFLHLTLSLVGQRVLVTQTSGKTFEGVFHTFTPFASQSPDKKNKYIFKACKGQDIPMGTNVIIDAAKVSCLHIKSIRLDSAPSNGNHHPHDAFRTDTEISGSRDAKGRDLVMAGTAWTQATSVALDGLEDSKHSSSSRSNNNKPDRAGIGEWDQFKANEVLFNVSASFDENVYTTQLDITKIDASKLQEAARLAREIESTASSNLHIAEERGHVIQGDFDEEDLYSGVLKTKDTTTPVPQVKELPKTSPIKPSYAAAAAKKLDAKTGPPGFSTTTKEEPLPKKVEQPVEKPEAKSVTATTPIATVTSPQADAPSATNIASKASNESKAAVVETKSTPPEIKPPTPEPATTVEPTPTPEELSDEPAATETPVVEQKPEESQETKEQNVEEEGDKKTQSSKLNPTAKSFTFNPAAKSFTPGIPSAPSPDLPVVDPSTGLALIHPQHPQPMMQPHYMHPGMVQPGMMPMMNAHFPSMRYPGAPYPGMEHHMAMSHVHQPQHMQQPPPPPPVPMPEGGVVSDEIPIEAGGPLPNNIPMPYGTPYYPAMMHHPHHPRGGAPQQPHQQHMGGFHMPQQMPYRPMYGAPMPQQPPLRGPGSAPYYPNMPMGGIMPYPQYAVMGEDDLGYRGRGGGARGGGGGPLGGGRGGGGRRNNRRNGGGRGPTTGGRVYYSTNGGGGSGRQTPQNGGDEDDGGGSIEHPTPSSMEGNKQTPDLE